VIKFAASHPSRGSIEEPMTFLVVKIVKGDRLLLD